MRELKTNKSSPPAGVITNVLLLFLGLIFAWASVNAIWGITSSSHTAASQIMANIVPLEYWVGCTFIALILLSVTAVTFLDRRMLVPFSMMVAYVVGVGGAEYAQNWIDPKGPILHRLFYLYAAIPMILVALAFSRYRAQYPLRIGGWSPQNSRWPVLAAIIFVAAIGVFCLRLAMDLGFVLIDWWPPVGTIVALSTLNGFTEELLFRGLLFPAFVIAVGLRWGILLQALLFGFIHLGSSEAWIGELYAAVYLVPLGAFFAYAAFKRSGLAWVAGLHAIIDIIGLSLIRLPQG